MSILSKLAKKWMQFARIQRWFDMRHANSNLSALSSSTILFWEWCAQSYTTVPAKIWTSVKLCEVSPLWGATLANSSHQPPPFCLSSKKTRHRKSSGSNAPTKPTTRPKWFRCLSNPIPPPSPSAAPRKAQSLELKKAPQSHQPFQSSSQRSRCDEGSMGLLPPNQPGKNLSSFVWERRWAGFKPPNP